MTKPPRPSSYGPPSCEPDFPDADVAATAPKVVPEDPANLAARLLLGNALAACACTLERASADGAVVLVLVPDACWTALARDAWRHIARNRQDYSDGFYDRGWHSGLWHAWSPVEEQRPGTLKQAGEQFARAVAEGIHCAGFAADPAWLPPDLVQAADHRLTLPPLAGADVDAIARTLCDGGTDEPFPDSQAAALTPRLLRLARRPDQTAVAYVHKLRDLLERDTAPRAPPAGSPRDAPTLDRLHGMDEAVAWGLDVARDLEAFKSGLLSWGAVDRGCLLSGPPGCGKTLFARALAATCGIPLVTGSYGEWHGSGNAHQGDLLKAMKQTFATARSSSPSILFIDEVDSFPDRSKVTHPYAAWEIQIVNALLAEIDGVKGRDGVILVAACNLPEKLDPALVRSGRLDRHVRCGLPDRQALAAILREHLGADLDGANLDEAALASSGASGADCERIVRGARRRARAERRVIAMADLLDEIGGADGRSADDLWLSSVHEAGHVVAACVLKPGSVVMATLRSGGELGGFTRMKAPASAVVRPADLRERLMMVLSGRAAEEEVFGVAWSMSNVPWRPFSHGSTAVGNLPGPCGPLMIGPAVTGSTAARHGSSRECAFVKNRDCTRHQVLLGTRGDDETIHDCSDKHSARLAASWPSRPCPAAVIGFPSSVAPQFCRP